MSDYLWYLMYTAIIHFSILYNLGEKSSRHKVYLLFVITAAGLIALVFFLTYDNITEGSVQKNYLLRSNLQKKQKAQIPTNSHECSPTQTAVQLEH